MKSIFLLLTLFIFIRASSQVNDSTEILGMRESQEFQFDSTVSGKVLPDFTAKDLNGKIYTNNSFRNSKVTFMNLWFVACEPCIAEIPNLNLLYDKMKTSPGYQFFGITYESEARTNEAIKKYDIHFPVLLVTPATARRLLFGRGYPTTMVLDRKGRVCTILSGGSKKAPGAGFNLFWEQEIEKVVKVDSSMEASK